MGVLNCTPDSFSDGGQFLSADRAWKHVDEMVKNGAEIIDIGAESTRPGAIAIAPEVQIQRLRPILETFKRRYQVTLSVDTTSSTVAQFAFDNGADIINDISALRFDPKMASVVAKNSGILILNHSRETPFTMQDNPEYGDVIVDVLTELKSAIQTANHHGITRLVIDPGIGFGKSLSDNLRLLNQLSRFKTLGYPILVGTSRKSFIAAITKEDGSPRLAGTIASSLWAVANGARIVRVHDVAEIKKALAVHLAIATTPKSAVRFQPGS